MPSLHEALAYAQELHQNQVRKGTQIPYLSHLLAVAALVVENGGDEDEAIAALLHDGPEDQGGEATLATIRERFGERVASIVVALSDTFEHPKPPWRARKEAHLAHLAGASPSVRLVALADKVHNLQTVVRDYPQVGERLWDRFTAGREGTLWYYRSMLAVLGEGARGTSDDPRLAPLLRQLAIDLDTLEVAVAQAGHAPTAD